MEFPRPQTNSVPEMHALRTRERVLQAVGFEVQGGGQVGVDLRVSIAEEVVEAGSLDRDAFAGGRWEAV